MLRATLYSDFTCPYCYLVERSTLPRLGADFGGLELAWEPFEVEPSGPPDGVPPVLSWYEAFGDRARELGLSNYQVPSWVPDTARVMSLAEFARSKGVLEAFRERAMISYWEERRNLDGDEALGALAREAGLDPAKALAAARQAKWRDVVIDKRRAAYERGVSAVPAVDFGNGIWVVGAQDDGVFWRAAIAASKHAKVAAKKPRAKRRVAKKK